MPGQPNSNTPTFLEGVGQAGEALLDMGAGALRGAVAYTLGTPGDVLELVRKAGVDAGLYKDSGKQGILPTTSRMEELLPPVVPPGAPGAAARQYSVNVGEAAGEWLSPGIVGAGARTALKNAPRALSEALEAPPAKVYAKAAKQRGMVLVDDSYPALPKAKEMELQGVDAKKIWADTGLLRDENDKWRYEPTDHETAFKTIDAAKAARLSQTTQPAPVKEPSSFTPMRQKYDGPSLGDELSGQTHTLKTLERLPQNQPEIQKRDIWRQLQRDDVAAPEKDILRYTMRQEPGQSIPAEQLVTDVKAATKGLELTGKDTGKWSDYGLDSIDRPSVGVDHYDHIAPPHHGLAAA